MEGYIKFKVIIDVTIKNDFCFKLFRRNEKGKLKNK